jgi:hypothetical protein
MFDTKATLEFLETLCSQAAQDAKAGDTALLNKITQNRAVAYYYNNVHALKSISAQAWAQSNPSHVKEADALREAYARKPCRSS